jgi:hypothetical protein
MAGFAAPEGMLSALRAILVYTGVIVVFVNAPPDVVW